MYEQLVADLTSADETVRFYAAQRLGTLEDARAVDALIGALNDAHHKVQYAALSGLIKRNARESLDAIVTMLLDALDSRVWDLINLNVGMRLRKGLIDMTAAGDTVLSDRLQEAIESQVLSEAQQALFIRMIGQTGDARRVEPFIEQAVSGPLALRISAVESLGVLADERAVASLMILLNEDDDSLRETAAEALGRIADARAVEPLLYALDDKSEWVRRAAAEALGCLGDDRAIEPLSDALRDEEVMVQDAAFESLKKLSSGSISAQF